MEVEADSEAEVMREGGRRGWRSTEKALKTGRGPWAATWRLE